MPRTEKLSIKELIISLMCMVTGQTLYISTISYFGTLMTTEDFTSVLTKTHSQVIADIERTFKNSSRETKPKAR